MLHLKLLSDVRNLDRFIQYKIPLHPMMSRLYNLIDIEEKLSKDRNKRYSNELNKIRDQIFNIELIMGINHGSIY